jgi:hypothetical protein
VIKAVIYDVDGTAPEGTRFRDRLSRGRYSADTFVVVRHDGLDFFALQPVKVTVRRAGRAERPWASGFEITSGTFHPAEQFPHTRREAQKDAAALNRPLRKVDATARN